MYTGKLVRLFENRVRQEVLDVVRAQPIIPAIAQKAAVIARQNPNFVRSDQGQVLGMMPEYEIPYGPPGGLPVLRNLVARYWQHRFKLKNKLGPENVCITTGATEALSINLRIVSPGQPVGINWIYWSNYKGIIHISGGTPVMVPLFDSDGNLTLDKAAGFVTEHGIRTILLNFPANPSGEGLLPQEYEAIAEFAREQDLLIISDEVYSSMAYEGMPLSMLRFAPERTVVIGAASKEYLIPGARIGYVISADPEFTNSWMTKLVRASTSNPNVLGQNRLIDLMEPDVRAMENGSLPPLLSKIRKELKTRRDNLMRLLDEEGLTIRQRKGQPPTGGISVLAYLPPDIKMDDQTVVQRAMALKLFSAVPGTAFGAPGGLRIGYGTMDPKNMEVFRKNIRLFIKNIRG